MSITIIIGRLFGFRLVGLLEEEGPQSSPISIKSSADIRQHFSVFSSSTLTGSIDCQNDSIEELVHKNVYMQAQDFNRNPMKQLVSINMYQYILTCTCILY